MAAKYFRAGVTNWDSDASWSTTSGGAADTTKPTAADDVFLDANSGNCTTNAAAVCRSLNCTGYTGTFTQSFSITIGDATAGASNIALKFVAGMTSSGATTFNFTSSSATVQTIDFAGKTTGNVFFTTGSYQYTGQHVVGTTATVTLTAGSLDINGQTCSWGLFASNNTNTRSLTLGTSTLTLAATSNNAWNTDNTTNMTLSAASSTIIFSGSSGNFISANTGGSQLTFGTVQMTSSADNKLNSNMTCTNFTRTGGAAKTGTFTIQVGKSLTCTGTFACNGNSATNRMLVTTSTPGTAVTITAATVSVTNSDFKDITGAGAGSWDLSAITGGSGDCGGNTNITFTTPATQTATGTASFSWSTHGWTTRVPLPQDDVVINNSFVAGRTVTADMPRLGKSINFTGATGSPAFALANDCSNFGSLTLASGMTATGNFLLSFEGRSSYTLTSAGINSAHSYKLIAPGGTLDLQDALTCKEVRIDYGTFNSNNLTITLNQAFSAFTSNTGTRTINLGTSNIIFSSNTLQGNFWNLVGTPTLSAASSTISLTGTSTATKTFIGAGLTYGTLTFNVAGATGGLDITGSNSFAAINFSDATNARTLRFTAATTTTIRNQNGFNVQGTSGKLMTISSVTAATHTLSSSSRQSCNYLHLTNSIAQGGGAWYAGANSTDNGGNTGWLFTNAPPMTAGGSGFGNIQSFKNLQNLQRFG